MTLLIKESGAKLCPYHSIVLFFHFELRISLLFLILHDMISQP